MINKNSKEVLTARKCEIEAPGSYSPTRYCVKFSLTQGELLALKGALENYPSVVGRDVLGYFRNALETDKIKLPF